MLVGLPVVGLLVGLDAGADDGFAVGGPIGRRIDGFHVDGFPVGRRIAGWLHCHWLWGCGL